MRENGRALALLLRTAWRTDRWRTLGLLLEPVMYLRVPLFAWFLKLVTDGALRHDARLLALGAGGIVATRALGFVGGWVGSWIRGRLTEEVGFALDRETAALAAGLPGLEHHEHPGYQDRLELLRQAQGALGGSLITLLVTANAAIAATGTLVALAMVSPLLLGLVLFALPALPIAMVQQRWYARAEERMAEPARRFRRLHDLLTDRAAAMELRVFGLGGEVVSRFTRAWREGRGYLIAAGRRGTLLGVAGDVVFLAGFAGGTVGIRL